MKAWQIAAPGGLDALELTECADLSAGIGEVVVRMHASSINYRDLSTVLDPAARNVPWGRIPNSDGAGEVAAVGEGVTRWQVGDRVAGCFFRDWPDGGITAEAMASALGGPVDGVLAEQVVFPAHGLVSIPDHLDYVEAATLPCAGLTAWRALVENGPLRAGETVLLLGTGGVSIFALQFALAHGARVIITSSSDQKLERARELGAHETINYRDNPEWEQAVMALTDGRGVDHVVEVGGSGTLARSVASARVGGHVALIGVLDTSSFDATNIMRRSVRVQGIYVGSRRMFEDMNRAIRLHATRPVIDKVFDFEQAPEAYRHMQGASHFGKLVIRIVD